MKKSDAIDSEGIWRQLSCKENIEERMLHNLSEKSRARFPPSELHSNHVLCSGCMLMAACSTHVTWTAVKWHEHIGLWAFYGRGIDWYGVAFNPTALLSRCSLNMFQSVVQYTFQNHMTIRLESLAAFRFWLKLSSPCIYKPIKIAGKMAFHPNRQV